MNKSEKSEYLHCKNCNKYYSSKSSLCNHNKKFHNINNICFSHYQPKYQPLSATTSAKNQPISAIDQPFINYDDNGVKKYCCRYCKHGYIHIQSRWKHEQKCNLNKKNDKELDLKLAKENNIRLKEEAEILRLKLKLQNSDKVDNITFQ